jgi:hypothetical protein
MVGTWHDSGGIGACGWDVLMLMESVWLRICFCIAKGNLEFVGVLSWPFWQDMILANNIIAPGTISRSQTRKIPCNFSLVSSIQPYQQHSTLNNSAGRSPLSHAPHFASSASPFQSSTIFNAPSTST